MTSSTLSRPSSMCLTVLLAWASSLFAASSGGEFSSTWPQAYTVQRDDTAGLLTLSTPYYTVQHDLKRGGAINGIRLTQGRATNLLVQPIAARVADETGKFFTDLKDPSAKVSHRKEGSKEIVTVETQLLDDNGKRLGSQLRTVFEYRWGYIKVHRELATPGGSVRAREVCPFFTTLTDSLADYGYREGTSEQEGAPPFSFGSNRWGKLRRGSNTDAGLRTPFVPRSMLFADAGVEGLEWFAGSDLTQWELQLAGRRGAGLCLFQLSQEPLGLALALSPFCSTNDTVVLPKTCAFDFYLGIPLNEGHALRPWLHTSFNRNQGNWVAPDQIRRWAETGIQTIHCHNDGDYYEDGLFCRDGSYPPYTDMDKFNAVITNAHQSGIRVATYFSNKELHPSTREFQEHGSEWGRMNRKSSVQHNFFKGTNEFGVQMCLRSGWLDFLKFSIDRVLKNHPLDGVYYDWNVALFCCNPLHEGKKVGEAASGHWDIDELLDLMEWTRRRVGPTGLVIVHNTTTPMFTMENFADYVVANEWGYGKWKEDGPALEDLPLEWSLAGARSRGVISYGQLDAQSPKRLHRVFALEALLGGVTPWPASPETFELFSVLRPLGPIEKYRFADWRNRAVTLDGGLRCASAIYSRAGEAYAVLANLGKTAQEVQCVMHPERLPEPLGSPTAATLLRNSPGSGLEAMELNVRQLVKDGVKVALPADSAVLLRVR